MNGPQDGVDDMRALYRKRRDVLVDGLARVGWPVPKPEATMFVWAPVPAALRDMGSLAFAKELLQSAEVAVAPGVGFGEHGEGYVRLGLVENTHRIRQAVRNIRGYFQKKGINVGSDETVFVGDGAEIAAHGAQDAAQIPAGRERKKA